MSTKGKHQHQAAAPFRPAYYVPCPNMICPECRGVGAMWPAGELHSHRCRSCNGHGKVHVQRWSA